MSLDRKVQSVASNARLARLRTSLFIETDRVNWTEWLLSGLQFGPC
jgi:hypothetical protein